MTRDIYCQDSVEAEFALSPDGLTLYYGDIFGKIVALSVAEQINPTDQPTPLPTAIPSLEATPLPTMFPSIKPSLTKFPSNEPSNYPSVIPTSIPTVVHSSQPSSWPSELPSYVPSIHPTFLPTKTPSTQPSRLASVIPTTSAKPSVSPTLLPSITPTNIPSESPSTHPTTLPSVHPSNIPSFNPTPYYGILTLKNVTPESQIVVVSFIGISGFLALLGFVLGSKRCKKGKSGVVIDAKGADEDLAPDADSMIAIGPSSSVAYSDSGVHESASFGSDKAMILGSNLGDISSSEDDRSLSTSLSSILEETPVNKNGADSHVKNSYNLGDVIEDNEEIASFD